MKLLLIMLLIINFGCSSNRKTNNVSEKVVIAHRGASGYLPEHTLESLTLAHAFNVDFIEADVVLTKDNKPIVLHDIYLGSTTNVKNIYPRKKRRDGRFYAVDFTLRQIKRLSVNERVKTTNQKRYFKDRFPHKKGSFEVPTLEEFIETLQGLNKTRKKDIGLYLEIKKPEFHKKAKKDITKITINTLNKYKMLEANSKTVLQCFYPPTLIRIKKMGIKVPRVFLIAEDKWNESSANYTYYKTRRGINEIATFADGIGPWVGQIALRDHDGTLELSKLVQWAHDVKLSVHPFTHRTDKLPPGFGTDRQFFDFLFKRAEVDGVFSDFSDRVIDYLANDY